MRLDVGRRRRYKKGWTSVKLDRNAGVDGAAGAFKSFRSGDLVEYDQEGRPRAPNPAHGAAVARKRAARADSPPPSPRRSDSTTSDPNNPDPNLEQLKTDGDLEAFGDNLKRGLPF